MPRSNEVADAVLAPARNGGCPTNALEKASLQIRRCRPCARREPTSCTQDAHSPSVSATRMPALYMCCAVRIGDRMADRTMIELDEKLPPRMTPISQFPG